MRLKYSIICALAIGVLYANQRHRSSIEKKFEMVMRKAHMQDTFGIGELLNKWSDARVKMLSDIGPLTRALRKLEQQLLTDHENNNPEHTKELAEWLKKALVLLDNTYDAILQNSDIKPLLTP